MARNFITNIQDLEFLYYHPAGLKYLNYDDRYYSFGKADADVSSTTTGVYNAVYGAEVWYQTNHTANTFGALPKYPATRTGWRVITADAGTTADGGVAETGAIPDTIKPTFLEVDTKPKLVAHAFGVTEIQQALAETGDDTTGDVDSMRKYTGSKHRLALDEQLVRDVGSTADTRFESIDRVVSSNAEVTNSGIDAGDSDIYGIDRDAAAGWFDAITLENSNVDRDLTATLLTQLMDDTREQGANSTFWDTGTDTYAAIQNLFEPQVRYSVLSETKATLDVNGIQSPTGIEIGLTFSQLFGLPVIIDPQIPKTDTLSRVYLLDTSDPEGFGYPRLGLRMHKPTQYFESGISSGNPFGINKFADEGVYRTMGELLAYRFDVHGKIRDLK